MPLLKAAQFSPHARSSKRWRITSPPSRSTVTYTEQLVPFTDSWLATGKGYHIVTDACRPHREVDEFAGWMADELVFEAASSS